MKKPRITFADRADAGRQLAARLIPLQLDRPVVYALPRGGVPVAAEVARALGAPLDLVLVRKIGAPGSPELALGAVVDGADPQTVINEDFRRLTGADDAYLARERERQLKELERRRARYLGGRAQVSPKGRTAIVTDDGLATGATMKAALIGLARQGAAKVVVALPVAPAEALPEIEALADAVICLNPETDFRGVGGAYDDFHQLGDDETTALLERSWAAEGAPPADGPPPDVAARRIETPPLGLIGDLRVPANPRGVVLFAHGSGSSRLSPRNRAVAEALNRRGLATLLLDLLTPEEAADRRRVFDIPLLAERLVAATLRISAEPDLRELPLGLFGASTGAGAALLAAAEVGGRVSAVVSRGGRPDLAGPRLAEVAAPTLLIVGGEDRQVIDLNRKALAALTCEKHLEIVPGATHLFEEPGALETVTDLAGDWFARCLGPAAPRPEPAATTPRGAGRAPAVGAAEAPLDIAAALRAAAAPLPDIDDPAFAEAFDRYGAARVVLLGEASHGTSEFYRARAAITRRLIERHGVSIVAVEADWPDAAVIDRRVRHAPPQPQRAAPFRRFPTWMWRNREVEDFVAWLRRRNADLPPEARAGFHGLDLYNMNASIAAVLGYLDRVDPETAAVARARYACLMPWAHEPAAYGRAALGRGFAMCEGPVMRILIDLLRRELQYAQQDGDRFFDAAQNARLVASAEQYYRVMYHGARESWNLRDRHMFETLQRLLEHGGAGARAVVWAHNSHIGDARYTDMGRERGELNLGQLCRQAFGRDAVSIGFGTHDGTVAAAGDWDGPMEIMAVRPSRPDSHEALCHEAGMPRFLLDLGHDLDPGLRRALAVPRLERYIGVVYRPETERWSHYSRASLVDQYDAFVWFDRTRAVTPLPAQAAEGEDETYPFGL